MYKYLFPLILLFSATVSAIEPDIECPIPKEQRIFNHTGSQCVWASLETIGRWAHEPKLYDLTKRSECQSYSDPGSVRNVLTRLGVKFEQESTDKVAGIKLIKKAMQEGRACLWGMHRTHAVVLLHYDTSSNRVHWTDNVDSSASTRLCTIAEFNNMWDGWVCVIYPDKDDMIARHEQIPIRVWYYGGK